MVPEIERNLTPYLEGIRDGEKLFHLQEGAERNGHIEWNVCIATVVPMESDALISWRDGDPKRWRDLHERWFPLAMDKRIRRFEFERASGSRIEWQLTLKYEQGNMEEEMVRAELERYLPILHRFAFFLIDSELEKRGLVG